MKTRRKMTLKLLLIFNSCALLLRVLQLLWVKSHLLDVGQPPVRRPTCSTTHLFEMFTCSTPTCSTDHLFDIIFEQVSCRTSGRSFVRQLSCSTDHLFDNTYLMRRKSIGEKVTKSRLITKYLPENEFLTDKIIFLLIYRKFIPKFADFTLLFVSNITSFPKFV